MEAPNILHPHTSIADIGRAVSGLFEATRAAYQDREDKKQHAQLSSQVGKQLEQLSRNRTADLTRMADEYEKKLDAGEISWQDAAARGLADRERYMQRYNMQVSDVYAQAVNAGANNPYSQKVFSAAWKNHFAQMEQQTKQVGASMNSVSALAERQEIGRQTERIELLRRDVNIYDPNSREGKLVAENNDMQLRSDALGWAARMLEGGEADLLALGSAAASGNPGSYFDARGISPDEVYNLVDIYEKAVKSGGERAREEFHRVLKARTEALSQEQEKQDAVEQAKKPEGRPEDDEREGGVAFNYARQHLNSLKATEGDPWAALGKNLEPLRDLQRATGAME